MSAKKKKDEKPEVKAEAEEKIEVKDMTPVEEPESPETPPDEPGPSPEEKEKQLMETIAANEARIKELEEKLIERKVEEEPDPDFYIFFHRRFRGDQIHLQNGHVITFVDRYARIPRTNPTDYELLKKSQLYREDGSGEIIEVNRMVVKKAGPSVSTGPVTTAKPTEAKK